MTEDSDKLRYGPGSFGCHEVMHMASVLAEMVSERLGEHPAVEQNPEWQEMAGRAAALLYQLYNDIGAVHMEASPIGKNNEFSQLIKENETLIAQNRYLKGAIRGFAANALANVGGSSESTD